MKAAAIALLVCVTAKAATDSTAQLATIEEVRSKANDVAVEVLDLEIPTDQAKAAQLLSRRLFSHPAVRKFELVTNTAWQTKWDILSSALVAKAKRMKLPSADLQRCLRRINRGRNEQSILGPRFTQRIVPADAPPEEAERIRKEDDDQNKKAEEEFSKVPIEDRFDDTIAFLPVAALHARSAGKFCWVILCTWEIHPSNAAVSHFGHVCFWAVDSEDLSIIAFAACD